MIMAGLRFLRADVQRLPFAGGEPGDCFLHDPLTMKFSLIGEREAFLIEQLEQGTPPAELYRNFEQRFSETLTEEALLQFIQSARQQQWALGQDVSGEGMATAARQLKSRRFWATLANPLAIRFRGINPSNVLGGVDLLAVANLLMGWLFTWPLVMAGCLMALAALTIVVTHPVELLHGFRLAASQPGDLWSLAGCLIAVKILHELAHGVVCLRAGGHCHELGLMLLVGTPVLYCDVTDSWRLPSRSSRMAIAAAGLYIEAWIASLATFLWWLAEPGMASTIALQLMFVCGVSSFLFNGNPLLKYDGYFLLADLLRMPNLAQRSRQALVCLIDSIWLQLDRDWPRGVNSHNAAGLVIYAVASHLFRIGLIFSIIWAVHLWLKPLGLDAIAVALGFATVTGMTLSMIWQTRRYLGDPQRREHLRSTRARCLALVVVGALAWALFWPFPAAVVAPGMVLPHGGIMLRAPVDGVVANVLRNHTVEAGDVVLELVDPAQQRLILEQRARVATQTIFLESLEQRQVVDPTAQSLIPAAQEELRDLQQQLAKWEAEDRRRVIRAPASGQILPIPRTHSRAGLEAMNGGSSAADVILPTWDGSIFDDTNAAAFVKAGTELAWIAPTSRQDVLATVSQRDVNRLVIGQTAAIWPVSATRQLLMGTITEISNSPIVTTGTNGGPSPTLTGPQISTSDQRAYEVRIRLDDGHESIPVGLPSTVKIRTAAESWFTWIARELRRILRIDW
jgi:putative peptide zinc metalloprotease protein